MQSDTVEAVIHMGLISRVEMPHDVIHVGQELFKDIASDNSRIHRTLFGSMYVYSLGRKRVAYYDRKNSLYGIDKGYAGQIKLELEHECS